MSRQNLSKRQARREKRRRAGQRSRAIVIAGVVLVALAVAALLIAPNFTPIGQVRTAESFPRPQAKGNAAGDPNAPIKMEEFSDFQCPVCERFYSQMERQLVETYVATGKIYLTYRSFGEFIGPESKAAAEAAYCAGDQDKFWEMHDIIFANQTGENVGNYSNRRLIAFAEKIGLDMDAFKSCFNGGTNSSRVAQDRVDGLATGMQGTPAFLLTYTVNGQPQTELISGAPPFSEFQSKIDAALQREAERRIQAAKTETAKRQAIRDHCILIVLLNTGLRVSELVSLRWDQVDSNQALFHVKRLKNGNPRPFKWPPRVVQSGHQ